MPFGISSAPEYFQRCMEKILAGLEGVICLMNNVLVYASDYDTHWRRLRDVLKRISESGMTLSKEKCQFGVQSVQFLGHIVSDNGVQPDPNKVKAIVEMQAPTTKPEARRLMGMVGYLSKFSKNISELCSPIYAVMGRKSEWYWGVEQQRSFDALKTELSNAPVLCAFDLRCKHRVSADASQYAIGAVLLQFNCRGEWQPVEYASRKLTETERRYSMVEKEALAITWACEKFDFYIVGREFEIETDHKPLVAILGEKDLSRLPLRVQRFKLRMMRYEETENDKRRALSTVSRGRTRGSRLPLGEVQGVWRAGPHAERLRGSLVLLLRKSRPPEGCLPDGEKKEGPTFSECI